MLKIAKQKGQGLIEMVIVILFIAIGVIALVKFQNYLSYSSEVSQQQNVASLLAVKQLETLKDFVVLNTTTGYNSYQSVASGSGSATVGNATYTLTWTVTSNTAPTYKNVDITVSWTDRYSGSQSVRLITNFAGIDPSAASSVM